MYVLSEKSAGGLVLRKGKILMVQVKNLENRIVWTFPKGHLEKGEKSLGAAIREVWEETGWQCRLTSVKTAKPFMTVRYGFLRNRRTVKKSVDWFVMKPVRKSGQRDPEEIRRVRWFSLRTARRKSVYGSDRKLLSALTPMRVRLSASNRRPQ